MRCFSFRGLILCLSLLSVMVGCAHKHRHYDDRSHVKVRAPYAHVDVYWDEDDADRTQVDVDVDD